jgi:hypothetical protein
MDNRGASVGRVLAVLAAVMVAVVLLFIGQLGIALVVLALAVIVGVAALFARLKTPTD